MNPRTGLDSSTPAVKVVPEYTYAEVISELETLGIIFDNEDNRRPQDVLSGIPAHTPYAVKLLAMYDREMLHRIMTAIRDTDEPARIIWRDTLGHITGRDITKRGKTIALTELARIMPQYERLLAINPIDAAIMNTGNKSNSRPFWNLRHSTFIEEHTGIAPGDTNYNLVQANLIHVNIMRPKKYDAENVEPYLQAHHEDITFIAEHVDETLRLLPELYKRTEASADAIATLLDVKPVLAVGAL